MAITITHLERGLNARFQQALSQELDARLMSIMMLINSGGRTENYAWLEAVGTLKEVISEVELDGVYKSNYNLTNKTYAKALSAKQEDIEDDQVGGIMQRVSDLTTRGRMFPMKLLMDSIIANDACYDGQAMFATTHSTGDSGAQSNLLTGTGTSLAQLKTDFDSALQAMLGFVDANGEPIHETDIGIRPLVLCPTALFGLFRDLANAALINNTSNTIQGAFDLVSSSRLTDANDWYLFNTAMPTKPYILQQRVPLSFSRLESNSDLAVLKERYAWKVRWRGVVGPGFWQMAVKTTNT